VLGFLYINNKKLNILAAGSSLHRTYR